jgi:hypothetical protein
VLAGSATASDLVGDEVRGHHLAEISQVDGAGGAETRRADDGASRITPIRFGDHLVRKSRHPVLVLGDAPPSFTPARHTANLAATSRTRTDRRPGSTAAAKQHGQRRFGRCDVSGILRIGALDDHPHPTRTATRAASVKTGVEGPHRARRWRTATEQPRGGTTLESHGAAPVAGWSSHSCVPTGLWNLSFAQANTHGRHALGQGCSRPAPCSGHGRDPQVRVPRMGVREARGGNAEVNSAR